MEYIFDDELFDVGAEIDAYCTRCKTNTPHTVLTKFEDEIRSVHCNNCNTSHAYRAPRGEMEEEIPEPIAARRRQSIQKLPWKEAMDQVDSSRARTYSPAEKYVEGEVLIHPKFGLGYVSEILSDTKIEVTFQDCPRILIYARDDLAISPDGQKAPAKKVRSAKPCKKAKQTSARSSHKRQTSHPVKAPKGTKNNSPQKTAQKTTRHPAKPAKPAKHSRARVAKTPAATRAGTTRARAARGHKGKPSRPKSRAASK